MITVYETLERPLVPVLARMERRGISIDRQVLSRLSGEFAQRAMGARGGDPARSPASRSISAAPSRSATFCSARWACRAARKTKTGAWSTDARVLEELAEQGHALPHKILDWRQVSKLRSTYTDALPGYVNPQTHRRAHLLRARRHHHRAALLLRSQPAEHPGPHRGRPQDPPRLRRRARQQAGLAPTTRRSSCGCSPHIADIPPLKQAFRDGLDIHAMTASEMFGVPVKGMPAEVRRRAKAINFGIIYGISAFGLANQLGIPREEAGAYIKKYFERFPGIRDYMDETQGVLPRERLRAHAVRAQVPLPRHRQLESLDPRLQRARRHQCARCRAPPPTSSAAP